MSTPSAISLSPAAVVAPAAPRTGSKIKTTGLTASGVVLFLMSLLVVASGFTSMRPEVFGLALHPYLIPVALCFLFVLMARISEFPVRVLVSLLVFAGMYFFSVFNGNVALGEILKTGSAVVTIVTCALLVRRRGDFVAGALGLSIAIAVLAARGLQEEAKAGIEVMQGANKNSYSLFALPAMLLGGYIALNLKTVPTFVKGLLIACAIPALAAIFMGGNRSGYLGAVLVGFMLFMDRRGKGLVMVGCIAAIVAVWITQFGSTKVLDERLRQTVQGNSSDQYRRDILIVCFQIGLDNPIIGVSPQALMQEIGRRTSVVHHSSAIEAHNAFAHVWAGSGAICLAALLSVGYTLWSWKPRGGGPLGGKDDPFRAARRLLRMMVFLWFVRAMFTREIMYNPSFNIAIGLCIGFCILAEIERRNSATGNTSAAAELPARRALLPATGG